MSFLAGFLLGVFAYAFVRAREERKPPATREVLQTEWPPTQTQPCESRLHLWPTQ